MKKILISLLFVFVCNMGNAQVVIDPDQNESLREFKQNQPKVFNLLRDVTGNWMDQERSTSFAIYFVDSSLMMSIEHDNKVSAASLGITGVDPSYNAFSFGVTVNDKNQQWQLHKVFNYEDKSKFDLNIATHDEGKILLKFVEAVNEHQQVDEHIYGLPYASKGEKKQAKKPNSNPFFVEYDQSPKITALPVKEATISPIKIKGFAINMTEQDFIDNLTALGEDEGSCSANTKSNASDSYEKYNHAKCRAFISDLLAEVYYFDGRAKKVYLNKVGSVNDVRQALVKRYGKPLKSEDGSGTGEALYFNDGDIAAVLHTGDFINYDVWEAQGTRIVLDKKTGYAVVSLYDISFTKQLTERISKEKQKHINTVLD